MLQWFRRKFRAETPPSVAALEARLAAMEQEVSKVRGEWIEVQGRLYAVLQRRGVKLKQETSEEAPAAPAEPRGIPANASKAQVKAALGLNTPGGVAQFLRGAR